MKISYIKNKKQLVDWKTRTRFGTVFFRGGQGSWDLWIPYLRDLQRTLPVRTSQMPVK